MQVALTKVNENKSAALKKQNDELGYMFLPTEVAKKSGCINSILIHSESKIPYDQIQNSNTIGISSGASAPEILVKNFINDLKNRFTISIDEVEIIKENVVFKIPKKLN